MTLTLKRAWKVADLDQPLKEDETLGPGTFPVERIELQGKSYLVVEGTRKGAHEGNWSYWKGPNSKLGDFEVLFD